MDIEKIRLRLINEQPYYALFLNKCKLVENEKVGTAGVKINKLGEIELHIAESFVDTLTIPHQVGLLIHEMLHIMQDHLGERGETMQVHQDIANIAMDIAINQLIDDHLLPPKAQLPEPYGLEKDLAYEPYYLELLSKATKVPKGGGTLDNHDFFSNEAVGGIDTKKVIADAMAEAMRECNERYPGKVPFEIQRLLDEMRKKEKVDWKAELRRFIGRNLSDHRESTRTRPNRRLGLAAMGVRREYVPKLLVLSDWSGSVHDDLACKFLDELKGILKVYGSEKTEVAFFDTEVVDKMKLNAFSKLPPRSRAGGTSFQAAFDYAREVKPDLLIMLTDGGDSMPDTPTKFPVLWCVPAEFQSDHLKGKVIPLHSGE